ncbi:protein EDS1L-like [Trifolium pratense]|uniref:protein EDS1L-like n=1 Tax=Trifolium pratense TaxID=57577 RepID=UPI001E69715F|nr:protein EDS1L-like [Trifolium pratense]XP_045790068.1 protein EDS1L-like [Trifolium pratense]XP_045790069.1 protein EDS1L-like [Trifolium pratense]XP_045790070.1 protein EDS1L-like [Trifolium pratense]
MAASKGGSEIMKLSADRIEKSLAASLKVHKTPEKPYLLEKNSRSNPKEVIISFPASGAFKDWFSKTTFGETEIDLKLFPSLRSIGNNIPALVNKFFLQRFQELLEKSSLKTEVDDAMNKKKQIVFAGHSSGGPVAILATLWTMEHYLTPKSRGGIHPLCITFGSPLVGNHIFSHATRRENWSEYFFQFVLRYDIVPRILLAPLSSLDQGFEAVSEIIDPKNRSFMSESSLKRIASPSVFYFEVMSNAATVTRHAACKLMGTTEATLETLANFVPLSPYKPFGTYIFSTTSGNEGKQIVMKNPDAILQVMFFSAQLSSEEETAQVSFESLRQHLTYGIELQKNLGLQNFVLLDQLEKIPLSEHTTPGSNIATINIALNDLGLSTRARLCIQAAAALEERKRINEKSIEGKKKFMEEKMNALASYRETRGHQKKGYYDAFKDQLDAQDFHANVWRLELAGVWDEIIEKLLNDELPDEFEVNEEWIDIGTKFRRLVEPLDIANYYRHSRNSNGRAYMDKGGRPKRYRYTQRWLEHAKPERRGRENVYSESCFWAEVEDLCYKSSKDDKENFEDVKEKVLELEKQMKKWNEDDEIGKDVFLEDSTFVKWWKKLPIQHRQESCIKNLVEV